MSKTIFSLPTDHKMLELKVMLTQLDPIGIFRELSKIPGVTFNEYLMYRYLIAFWQRFAHSQPLQNMKALEIEFTPSGQLRVKWTGKPSSKRRLILITHVDKEGFLVKECSENMKQCVGWRPTMVKMESECKGKEVTLVFRKGKFSATIAQVLEDKNMTDGEQIIFDIQDHIGDGEATLIDTGPFIGIGEYRLDPFEVNKEGVIASPCVDNHAGVAVATTVLMGMCLGGWPVNVDILYTVCEENGLLGMVKHILKAPQEIEDPDLAWIAVDCSNLQKCIGENLPSALRQNAPSPENQLAPIDLRTAVIRTGDKRSIFSRDVAHMLWVASLNAFKKLSLFRKNSSKCQIQEEFVLCNFQSSPDIRESEQAEIRGARMVGGVCESLPLVLASELFYQYLGWKGRPVPQIGSVCIPLSNFRYNTFEGTIAREECHVSAILMACTLLGEAAKVHERYSYKASSRALPASNDIDPVKDTERLLRMLKNNGKCLKVTEEWVDKQRPLLI